MEQRNNLARHDGSNDPYGGPIWSQVALFLAFLFVA